MSFAVGIKVGAYEFVDRLGKGGMATVCKGHPVRLDRAVAIKVLHPNCKDDDSFWRRFTRELQVGARLEHAHIMPVHDFAEHQGYPYLVMRHIVGETLKERLLFRSDASCSVIHSPIFDELPRPSSINKAMRPAVACTARCSAPAS